MWETTDGFLGPVLTYKHPWAEAGLVSIGGDSPPLVSPDTRLELDGGLGGPRGGDSLPAGPLEFFTPRVGEGSQTRREWGAVVGGIPITSP